ncbi:hypothetical protein [Anaerobacillus sp. 1_MG-2023]|mgnify:CR=1 FL=1|uniref:hypothetical protein n=1 Tax=Anaerobacillus sp. 1_MG-2023 TaxID=3062655 RepID=UPI0026E1FB43|nr:hypothetical protein [Anaerobacillus sp. 1_MG-2023]MDO6657454.1 hypothetical protein [Anaerobacillus sp. 1_MG-2023]
METLLKIITDTLPMIGALGGAFIGGFISKKSQHDLFKKELNKDRENERRKERRETLELYNEVLKIDGEQLLVTHLGGHYIEFDIDIYKDKVRPVLYLKYHLIDKDIATCIREIDHKIAECNFREEITNEEKDDLAHKYNKLIDSIHQHIEKYRVKIHD